MEFFVDRDSPMSAIKQIQEQIKLAVAMGALKPGDALPSIRDIEKHTGINRGQIHRAYLALKRSGLLAPSRGKGTIISAAPPIWHRMNEKCWELNRNIVLEVRKMGFSPTAFARYLSRHALDFERRTPLISYVDPNKEIAAQRAAEISELWQVPLIGLTPPELRRALRNGSKLRKTLANHLICDHIRAMIPNKRIHVIAVKIVYTEQTIDELARIEPKASVLVVLPHHAIHSARFITKRLRAWMKSPRIEISAVSVRSIFSFQELLRNPLYDRILVTPGARGIVPHELRASSRILLVHMQLDKISLEAARVSAGVIA